MDDSKIICCVSKFFPYLREFPLNLLILINWIICICAYAYFDDVPILGLVKSWHLVLNWMEWRKRFHVVDPKFIWDNALLLLLLLVIKFICLDITWKEKQKVTIFMFYVVILVFLCKCSRLSAVFLHQLLFFDFESLCILLVDTHLFLQVHLWFMQIILVLSTDDGDHLSFCSSLFLWCYSNSQGLSIRRGNA